MSLMLEVTLSTIFIRTSSFEVFLHPTEESTWGYRKDSPTDRELNLGKLKLIVSKV